MPRRHDSYTKCSVPECLGNVVARSWCRKHYQRWKKHNDPLWEGTATQRFWRKVDKSGPVHPTLLTNCWNWVGRKDPSGYASFKVNNWPMLVHRFSWELHNGPIGEVCVLHSCDNRVCVNPGHLFLGTKKDNSIDRDSKGRQAKGENNGTARLTKTDVLEIRRVYSQGVMGYRKLAVIYRVDHTQIARIVHRKQWRHI